MPYSFWWGITASFICLVTDTQLDIPRPLIKQSWTTGRTPRQGDIFHPSCLAFSHEGRSPGAGFEPTAVKDLLITSGKSNAYIYISRLFTAIIYVHIRVFIKTRQLPNWGMKCFACGTLGCNGQTTGENGRGMPQLSISIPRYMDQMEIPRCLS